MKNGKEMTPSQRERREGQTGRKKEKDGGRSAEGRKRKRRKGREER